MSPALPLAIGSRDDALDVLVVEEQRRRARDELRIRCRRHGSSTGLSTLARVRTGHLYRYTAAVPMIFPSPKNLIYPPSLLRATWSAIHIFTKRANARLSSTMERLFPIRSLE